MAIHARAVPRARRIIFPHIRRKQEGLIHWRPHFLSDDVAEWKLLQGAALAGIEPQDLQCMGTGHEHDLLWVTIAAAVWAHADKELIAAALCFVFTPVECQFERAHRGRKRVRRRYLCHGAME